MMNIIGIIPARLESDRFPNKILQQLGGKTLIDRLIETAKDVGFTKLVVVTDSLKLSALLRNKVDVIYDNSPVWCGSQRVLHVYKQHRDYDYYVTIPADEALLTTKSIRSFVNQITDGEIYTAYTPFKSIHRLMSFKSCKISSSDDGVIYVSRAIIPATKTGSIMKANEYKQHVGLFAFRRDIIGDNIWAKSNLADIEGLEQNAFIENGYTVSLIKIDHNFYGIDEPNDLAFFEGVLHE